MFHGYAMVLIGELRASHIPILPPPYIPNRGPIVPLYKPRYMPAPLCPLGNWGFFAQTQGLSQDLRYTSGSVGPSTGSLAGDSDDDGDQYFKEDNSQ
nr:hypothetical protein CFP56_59534 [Quercus suber]